MISSWTDLLLLKWCRILLILVVGPSCLWRLFARGLWVFRLDGEELLLLVSLVWLFDKCYSLLHIFGCPSSFLATSSFVSSVPMFYLFLDVPKSDEFQSSVLEFLRSLVHIFSFSMLQVLLVVASQVLFFLDSFSPLLPIVVYLFFFIFSNRSSRAWLSSCSHTNKWSPKRITPWLSFSPLSCPAHLERISALEFAFPGRYFITKLKSCRSITHCACRLFRFCGFLKYVRFWWSVKTSVGIDTPFK